MNSTVLMIDKLASFPTQARQLINHVPAQEKREYALLWTSLVARQCVSEAMAIEAMLRVYQKRAGETELPDYLKTAISA